MDGDNVLLNGGLKEEIYMQLSPGFDGQSSSTPQVCRLSKALYILKQASGYWFLTVRGVLLSLGSSQSRADCSLFFRKSGTSVIYILIYVDDMLITGNYLIGIQNVIQQLCKNFSLKDLGDVNLFLGIEINRTAQGLHLHQGNYIKDILDRLQMSEAKGNFTPMVSSCGLSKGEDNSSVDGKVYRSTVGALQYSNITRPEIDFSLNKVSQYMSSPLDTHWKVVKRILRYLAGTTVMAYIYRNHPASSLHFLILIGHPILMIEG